MAHWECKKCKGTNIIAVIEIFGSYEIATIDDNMEPQQILLEGRFIPVAEWLEIMFWEELKIEQYECKSCGHIDYSVEDMAEWIDPNPTKRIIKKFKKENKRLREKIAENERKIKYLRSHPISL